MLRTVLGSVFLLLLGWNAQFGATALAPNRGTPCMESEHLCAGEANLQDGYASRGSAPQDTARVEDIRTPNTYYRFLHFLDDSASVEPVFSRSVIRRQLDGLRVLLSDSAEKALDVGVGAETGRAGALAPGAGREIERWWRRKDPYPATKANERLQEHLRRVSYAFQHYSQKDDNHRLDDRGRVYVRYGPPNRSREFSRGEFWTYGFQTAAEFLFVCERGDGCELGQPVELIPPRLRHGHGPTDRGMRKSLRSLAALESIYEQLAHHRSRYGITYSDLSMYTEQIRQRLDGLNTPLSARPHSFVAQKIAEITQEEAQVQRRRAKIVPHTRSKVKEEFEELPVAARWMRLLNEDGTTTVELAWSVSKSALAPAGERADGLEEIESEQGGYLLSASLVKFSEAYGRQGKRTRHVLMPVDEEYGILDPRRDSFRLQKTPNAALQVDLSWATIEAKTGSIRPQAKLKVGTSRADSLTPLHDDPSRLEMSDLQPVLLRSDSMTIDEAPVYPFQTLPPTVPLALRFEVYHLSTGAEERTQYSVEYEVLRRTDRGNFERFLRGDEQERTAVTSRVEGRTARTTEYVLLDPANWLKDEAQTVRVTVEITDERTGQDISRAVEFDLPSKNQ